MVEAISREPGGNLYAKYDPKKYGVPAREKEFCPETFVSLFGWS